MLRRLPKKPYPLWQQDLDLGLNDRDRATMLYPSKVHNSDAWLNRTPAGTSSAVLWDHGYTFDYISER